MPRGSVPTGIGVPAVFVEVSIGVTVLLPLLTTYAVAPLGVMAIARGDVPTGIASPSSRVRLCVDGCHGGATGVDDVRGLVIRGEGDRIGPIGHGPMAHRNGGPGGMRCQRDRCDRVADVVHDEGGGSVVHRQADSGARALKPARVRGHALECVRAVGHARGVPLGEPPVAGEGAGGDDLVVERPTAQFEDHAADGGPCGGVQEPGVLGSRGPVRRDEHRGGRRRVVHRDADRVRSTRSNRAGPWRCSGGCRSRWEHPGCSTAPARRRWWGCRCRSPGSCSAPPLSWKTTLAMPTRLDAPAFEQLRAARARWRRPLGRASLSSVAGGGCTRSRERRCWCQCPFLVGGHTDQAVGAVGHRGGVPLGQPAVDRAGARGDDLVVERPAAAARTRPKSPRRVGRLVEDGGAAEARTVGGDEEAREELSRRRHVDREGASGDVVVGIEYLAGHRAGEEREARP